MEGGQQGAWRPQDRPEGLAALDLLMAPETADTFFTRHYDKSPVHCPRGDLGRYAHLLTLEAVDALIDGADLRQGMVELIRDGRRVPDESFTSADGRIIASAIAEQYLGGATVALPHLQESLGQLRDLCRALEALFSCHVQANAYLTPGSHGGFAPHHDMHDVFVLQIHGAKTWRLYDRSAPAGLRGDITAAGIAGEPSEILILHPGDCLYLPRGWVHAATNAGGEPSLHVTIGLLTRTWADLLLAAAIEVARADPAFARALPPGLTPGAADEVAEKEFARMTRELTAKMSMAPALELLTRDFLHGRRPKTAGVFASSRSAAERYRRRPLVQWRLSLSGQDAVLTGPGGDLNFAKGEADALEIALSGMPFLTADLPCPSPSRLFRTLWANGYLERAAAL